MSQILFNKEFGPSLRCIKPPKFSSFIEMVEWGLFFLDYESRTMLVASNGKEVFDYGFESIKTFDGSIIIGDGHNKINEYDQNYNISPIENEIVNLGDIDNDLTGCKFYQISANSDKISTLFCKCRLLDIKEIRGTDHIGKKIIEASMSLLMENEKWFNVRFHYWILPSKMGEKDRLCSVRLERKAKAYTNDGFFVPGIFEKSLQMQFANYYQWFAYIKEDKNIGFKIPIAPESTKDIFELRDVSDSGRKKAILHWVSQHYRNTKAISDIEEYRQTLVKQHLRGETKFRWRGLEVHLLPAKYDIKRVNSKKKYINI